MAETQQHDSPFNRVSAPVREVLELFARHGEALRFPDVDAESLSGLGEDVAEATMEVAKAEATLRAAREELERREETLLLQAKRGVAYARVFAEADPELMEELSALALARPKADKPSRTPRRKRTAKSSAGGESPEALPFPAGA